LVPFTVGGTATPGPTDDFTITASPITIPAGSTSADVTITVNDDPDNEPDETVIITIGTPTNAFLGSISEHTSTIEDNDVTVIAVLDVTGNGNANPFQDGILIVRFMLGQPDANLEDPALIPAGSTRTTGAEIRAFLEAAGDALDVNGDGTINPFQDGILIVRFLLGQPDVNLEDPALIPPGSTRTTGAEIRAHLETLLPPAANSEGEFVLRAAGSAGGESASQSPVSSADVDADGSVTARDAFIVLKAIQRAESNDDEGLSLDTNRDGKVTASDALYVINRLADDSFISQIALAVSESPLKHEASDAVDHLLSDQAFVEGLF
jgi:hypothetical protein